MPKLKEKYPDVTLDLIGKEAPEKLSNYAHLGVNMIGYVDSVQQYLNQSMINISPLFVGGGIRIKILEAMAMKLPIVATSLAAEGIEADESHGLFRCDNEDSFLQVISQLFEDVPRIYSLGEEARELIIEKYTWQKSVQKIYNTYVDLITH